MISSKNKNLIKNIGSSSSGLNRIIITRFCNNNIVVITIMIPDFEIGFLGVNILILKNLLVRVKDGSFS